MALPDPSTEVCRLARNGQKIEAIKRYRIETGVSLGEAKAVVDRLPRGEVYAEPPTESKKSTRSTALFLGATVLGFIGLCVTGPGTFQALATSTWVSTDGEITESELVQGHFGRNDRVAVSYRYNVSGSEHTGDRISHTIVFGGFYNTAFLARYPEGAGVAVYYDPDEPSRSVLERQVPLLYWTVFAASIGAFFFGVRSWIIAARQD